MKFYRKSIMIFAGLLLIAILLNGCSKDSTDVSKGNESGTKVPEESSKSKVEDEAVQSGAENIEIATGWYNLNEFEELIGKKITEFKQSPLLDERVSSGELPPVGERLPTVPLVLHPWEAIGEYGGTLRFSSLNSDQDWELRHINNINLFQRAADPAFDSVSSTLEGPNQPGILESWELSEDALVFTAKIREGLKWSDGVPVTTDDVAYKINDDFLNKDLNPSTTAWLRGTTFEVLDKFSFRFTFDEPYGSFLEVELRKWPGTWSKIMNPKHYMEQFHKDYGDMGKIKELMEADGYHSEDEWSAFYKNRQRVFGVDFIGLAGAELFPTLNPYVPIKDLGNGDFLYERNPYFGVIDSEGNQLPYIDQYRRSFALNEEVQNLDIISGKSDFQAQTISIDNFTLYKDNEERGNYNVLALPAWQDQVIVFSFNLAPEDPELGKIYSDVRFRRALSIGLDRDTMNEQLFLGLGRPSQAAPRPGSPFYEEGMEEAYAQYDPEEAKRLLDEMGLIDQNNDGWRDRLDGKPFSVNFEYFIITGSSTPAVELAERYWGELGIRVNVKQIDPGYYWETLHPNNAQEATTWWLGGSGADIVEGWFIGFGILTPKWSRWGTYELNNIPEDERTLPYAEPLPWAKELLEVRHKMMKVISKDERDQLGKRAWQIQAEYVPTIGVVTESRIPLVHSKDLGNIGNADEKGYTTLTVMDNAVQWYFKNSERR